MEHGVGQYQPQGFSPAAAPIVPCSGISDHGQFWSGSATHHNQWVPLSRGVRIANFQ